MDSNVKDNADQIGIKFWLRSINSLISGGIEGGSGRHVIFPLMLKQLGGIWIVVLFIVMVCCWIVALLYLVFSVPHLLVFCSLFDAPFYVLLLFLLLLQFC